MNFLQKQSVVIKLSRVALAALLAALGACSEMRVEPIEKVGDDGSLVQGSKPPSDSNTNPDQCSASQVVSCADAGSQSIAFGFDCDTQALFTVKVIGDDGARSVCENVFDACNAYAAKHPDANVGCISGNRWIYRKEVSRGMCNPPSLPGGGCEDACAVGSYLGEGCRPDGGSISTEGITCGEALENCRINALLNPTESWQCWFDGKPLYEHEVTPGACSAFP